MERQFDLRPGEEAYFPISPFMIFPEAQGDFSIYLRRGRNYLLFSRQGEAFTEKHKTTLNDNGVTEVYIRLTQKPAYDKYLEEHLSKVLLTESIPVSVRATVLYYSTTGAIEELVESRIACVHPDAYAKLLNVVRASTGFLATGNAMRALAAGMSHSYRTCTHSANVCLLSLAVSESCQMEESEKIQLGLGALLHDVGKSRISKFILNKRGRLNSEEWEIIKTHPVKGAGLCSMIPMEQPAIQSILFHHERCDGSGYPAGLIGTSIPLHAKIVGIVDTYDAVTSKRPYADDLPHSQALTLMRDDMKAMFDQEVVNQFAAVLIAAGVVGN